MNSKHKKYSPQREISKLAKQQAKESRDDAIAKRLLAEGYLNRTNATPYIVIEEEERKVYRFLKSIVNEK